MMDNDIDNNAIRRLDGGLLLVFRELARRGRTTEVALKLGLSQSAVSHALSRLRDLFDDPLFVRRSHGLEPTKRALELAPRIDALIDLANGALRRDADFNPARSERRFVLAAEQADAALVGASLVEQFRRDAPSAGFTVRPTRGAEALSAVRHGEIDLAIGRFGPLPDDLAGETLYRDEYCVVARRGHPEIAGSIDPATWARIGHVFCGPPTGVAGVVEDPLPSAKQVATIALVPQWLTALVLVSDSDAIATVPRRLAERQARVLNLQIMDSPFPEQPFEITLARRAAAEDAGVEWFRSQVKAAAG